jgi:hypothetical protein
VTTGNLGEICIRVAGEPAVNAWCIDRPVGGRGSGTADGSGQVCSFRVFWGWRDWFEPVGGDDGGRGPLIWDTYLL